MNKIPKSTEELMSMPAAALKELSVLIKTSKAVREELGLDESWAAVELPKPRGGKTRRQKPVAAAKKPKATPEPRVETKQVTKRERPLPPMPIKGRKRACVPEEITEFNGIHGLVTGRCVRCGIKLNTGITVNVIHSIDGTLRASIDCVECGGFISSIQVKEKFDDDTVRVAKKVRVPLAKHAGMTLGEIAVEDISYVQWLASSEFKARNQQMRDLKRAAKIVAQADRSDEFHSWVKRVDMPEPPVNEDIHLQQPEPQREIGLFERMFRWKK